MYILDALDYHARFRPGDTAILHAGGSVTFGQLRAAVAAAASRLREQRIDPLRPVGVYVADSYLQFVLMLALMHEATPSFSGQANHEAPPAGVGFGAFLADRSLPFAQDVPVISVDTGWLTLAKGQGIGLERRAFESAKSLVRIIASSGTSGLSKAVAFNAEMIDRGIEFPAKLGSLGEAPSLTTIGLSSGLGFRHRLGHLQLGNLQIFPPSRLGDVLNVIRLYGVKFLTASPQQLQLMLDIVDAAALRLPSLEHVRVAGSIVPRVTILRTRSRMCPNVTGDYGCTEVGMVAEAPADLLERIPGCAGFVHPWNKVEIVDDADRPLPPGTDGNVRIWTPSIVSEYLGSVQDGDGTLRGGWFYPGDLGQISAEGVLTILGRSNEVINAGGVKVSPDLISGTLMSFAGIRDAAALGIDYPDRPTEICAAVVTPQPIDAPALLEACRRILLGRAPHRIVRVEQIPRNQMGKVMLRELRQLVG